MERREFIKNTAAFCGALGILSLEGCYPYRRMTPEYENGKLKVGKAELLNDTWVVLQSDKTNAPILLFKDKNGEYSAVLMLCTHKQCEVKPSGTILSCPCHGSEFAFSGKALKEPADKDLLAFQTSQDDNFVYVHL